MDDVTRNLWREAEAAIRKEVLAELEAKKTGRSDGRAAICRLQAVARLVAHRKRMIEAELKNGCTG